MLFRSGIDTDSDGYANAYTGTPTAVQLAAAVTARVYVLVRTQTTIAGYVNDKTYRLGGATVGPFNDGFYRRVYTSTVVLRNTVNRSLLN